MKINPRAQALKATIITIGLVALPSQLPVNAQSNQQFAEAQRENEVLVESVQQENESPRPLTYAYTSTDEFSKESIQQNLESVEQNTEETLDSARNAIAEGAVASGQVMTQTTQQAEQKIEIIAQTAEQNIESATQRAQQEVANAAEEAQDRANWGWLGLIGLLGLFGLFGNKNKHTETAVDYDHTRGERIPTITNKP
ncbi:MAG: WGxxGxxG family protein [Microcoleaceae cyanobacterium]